MMETPAQLFSAEQFQTFLFVIACLIATNFSAIAGGAVEYFRKIRRMRVDINAAHVAVRAVKEELKDLRAQIDLLKEKLK